MNAKKLLGLFASIAFALVIGLVLSANSAYASEKLDINNLRDGEYEVGLRMVQYYEPDRESMANGAIDHHGKLIVKDGKAFLQMRFGFLNLGGKQGHLGWLKVNHSAEGGTYEPVEVVSYFLDEDGNRLKDEFNSGDVADNMKIDYVQDIKFEVPKYVFKDREHRTRCQVFVPVMEGISEGMGTQEVYTVICFNGVRMNCLEYGKEVNLNIPPIKPTQETLDAWEKQDADLQANKDAISALITDDLTEEELSLVKVIVDKAVEEAKDLTTIKEVQAVLESAKKQVSEVKTNKTITDTNKLASLTSLLSIDSELVATELSKADYAKVVGENYKVEKAINLTLNHELTQKAKVEINVDKSLNGQDVRVFHLNRDNSIRENFDVKVVDNKVVVEVDDLSPFVIAKKSAKPVTPEKPVSPVSPTNPEPVDVSSDTQQNLDFASLADGQYTISGEMIKTNRTDKSMSNNAIDHNILLSVENGQYFVTITFKGLKVGQKLGFLGKLKYYDDNGQLQNAEVISSITYDGKTYPEKVKVALNSEAMKTGWQKLQVFVQTMEDIAKGCGTQDVFLKLDLNSVKGGAPTQSNFSDGKSNSSSGTPKTGDLVSFATMSLAAVAGGAALVESRKFKQN